MSEFFDTFVNIFLLRIFPLSNIYSWKLLRKIKWEIPGEPVAARYNWCQGPVPGRGPAVEKHCLKVCHSHFLTYTSTIAYTSTIIGPFDAVNHFRTYTKPVAEKLRDNIGVCTAQCRKINSFLRTICLLLLFTTVNIYYCLLHPLLVLLFPRILEGNNIYCYEREV